MSSSIQERVIAILQANENNLGTAVGAESLALVLVDPLLQGFIKVDVGFVANAIEEAKLCVASLGPAVNELTELRTQLVEAENSDEFTSEIAMLCVVIKQMEMAIFRAQVSVTSMNEILSIQAELEAEPEEASMTTFDAGNNVIENLEWISK